MTRHRLRLCGVAGALSALAMAVLSHAAEAQDKGRRFVIEALPDHLARRVDAQRRMLRQFGLGDADKTPKGVINALKIWTTEHPTVRVCFFGGSQALRARIARVALEWKQGIPSLPLDFGDPANPRLCKAGEINQIRIGYKEPGYWSLVGTDSFRLAGQAEQSMNFEAFDTDPPPAEEFRAAVLHEFGHAIGLEHEHQSPLSKCRDEFDWPKIYSLLGGSPNFWSKEKVDFNMGALHEQGLQATTFDRTSIMLYTFPPAYFKNGTRASCYSKTNTRLSNGDKAIVGSLYPGDTNARVALIGRIRAHHLSLIDASGRAKGARSGVLQLIDEYLPESATVPKQ